MQGSDSSFTFALTFIFIQSAVSSICINKLYERKISYHPRLPPYNYLNSEYTTTTDINQHTICVRSIVLFNAMQQIFLSAPVMLAVRPFRPAGCQLNSQIATSHIKFLNYKQKQHQYYNINYKVQINRLYKLNIEQLN